MDAERFLLKWNNHQSNLVTVFDQLYEQEAFTDVTLACDGRSFAAHKVILSACSPYFQQLFLSNPCKHPIIFMRDVKANDLDALLAFMYRGEINVHQQDLASFLKTAESLQIKGLSDSSDKPRDTSKILEAMEKKFSSNNNNNHSSNNNNHSSYSGLHSSNNIGGFGNLGSLINSALSRSSPVPSVTNAAGLGILNRSLMSQANSSPRETSVGAPPSKKFKSLAHEDFSRMLPKIKSMAQQSLLSSLPGLMTPNSLAATVMKNAAAAAATHRHLSMSPYTNVNSTERNHSPINNNSNSNSSLKDKAKESGETEAEKDSSEEKSSFQEGYISGDTPHPVYLVSSVGGLGMNNSSGNSTPSHEVKIEEEDPLDESNNFSDDPVSLPPSEPNDDQNLGFGDDSLLLGKDRLTYPCRFCGKRFTQTGTCRRHERLHTAPNSFKCPFCQKGFNRKYRLKEHIISTHPEQAESNDIAVMVNNSDTSIP